MKAQVFTFLAESSIHVGSSKSEGVVDLPVAREAVTGYPYVPGSGLKGALRQHFTDKNHRNDRDDLFGADGNAGTSSAGDLLIGDARLLFLPVRSLNAASMWVSCPHLLERYCRDLQIAGYANANVGLPEISDEYYFGPKFDSRLPLMLEERELIWKQEVDKNIIELAKNCIANAHKNTLERLGKQLVLVSDNDFAWFARNALPVNAHNQLDEKTKQSKNLWYEESLPPDTILYALVGDRKPDGSSLGKLKVKFTGSPYLRLGGNETTGMGWIRVYAREVTAQ